MNGKKKRFRPVAKLKLTAALMIRLTDSQRRRFERRAAVQGLSTSTWARMILLRELGESE
jgi:hypothetical protein